MQCDLQNLRRKHRLRDATAEAKSGFGVSERCDKRALRGRQRESPEIHSRDDRECTQRSDQQLMQIVARHVFHDAPAALGDHTIACNEFHSETKVPHSAVEVAQWRTGVCGDDAADGGAIGKGTGEWEKLICSPRTRNKSSIRTPGSTPRVRSRGSYARLDSSARDRGRCRNGRVGSQF